MTRPPRGDPSGASWFLRASERASAGAVAVWLLGRGGGVHGPPAVGVTSGHNVCGRRSSFSSGAAGGPCARDDGSHGVLHTVRKSLSVEDDSLHAPPTHLVVNRGSLSSGASAQRVALDDASEHARVGSDRCDVRRPRPQQCHRRKLLGVHRGEGAAAECSSASMSGGGITFEPTTDRPSPDALHAPRATVGTCARTAAPAPQKPSYTPVTSASSVTAPAPPTPGLSDSSELLLCDQSS